MLLQAYLPARLSPDELDPTWVQRVVGFRPDTVRPLVNRLNRSIGTRLEPRAGLSRVADPASPAPRNRPRGPRVV
jgi:hypothetical protein